MRNRYLGAAEFLRRRTGTGPNGGQHNGEHLRLPSVVSVGHT